jgi:hypothetical protein
MKSKHIFIGMYQKSILTSILYNRYRMMYRVQLMLIDQILQDIETHSNVYNLHLSSTCICRYCGINTYKAKMSQFCRIGISVVFSSTCEYIHLCTYKFLMDIDMLSLRYLLGVATILAATLRYQLQVYHHISYLYY